MNPIKASSLVTSLLLALAAVDSVVSLGGWKQMDCSGVKRWSLVELKADANSPCNLVAKRTETDELLETLDLVYECTCQLVDKEVVWQTFLNEGVHNTLSSFMDRSKLKLSSSEMEWTRYLQKSVFGQAQSTKKNQLELVTNEGYQIPLAARTDIKPNYVDRHKNVETSCARHVARFAYFYEIFMQMSSAVGNQRLIEEIGRHSPSLFKSIVAYYLCESAYNPAWN